MQSLKKIVMTSAIVLFSTTSMAENWDVVQSYTNTSAATTLDQTGTTGAVQTLNHINLDATDGTVNNSGNTQTVTTTGQSLSLSQSGATGTSTQAANRISAHTVTNATQTLTADSTVTLSQETTGNNNLQAINDAQANTLTALTQNASPSATAGTYMLEQGKTATTGNNNIQAVNNAAVASGGTITALTQNVKPAGSVTITLNQGETGTGTDNEQALNRISVDTSVQVGDAAGSVLQDVTATAAALDFDQKDATGVGSVQAANLINATTTSGTTDAVKQVVSVNTLAFDQTSTEAVLQAGNALVNGDGSTGSGGALTQEMTLAGTANFTQTSANGSYQAANYLGNEIQ